MYSAYICCKFSHLSHVSFYARLSVFGLFSILHSNLNLVFQNPPLIAILPLGTGNDLSRVLGWGEGHTMHDVGIPTILHQVETAEPDLLDR